MPILKEGFWFPDDCGDKYKASLTKVKACHYVIRRCEAIHRTDLVIQAGGSMGIWPWHLSKIFKEVWSFEPESISFECLEKNVSHIPNVKIFPMALGQEAGSVGIKRKSLTSHKIIPEQGAGVKARMITIDSLDISGVKSCDAILLDIEGFEKYAIQGAKNLIERFHPLILAERREDINFIGEWLAGFGYGEGRPVERDMVYECIK